MADQSSLSDSQEAVLALLSIIPASISIFCSLVLMRHVYLMRFASVTSRILFPMSLYDCSNSVTIVLQNFLTPAATSRRLWAVGTDKTCAVLGFLFQFNYPSMMYFGALSFYYLVSIRFRVSDEVFRQRFEPAMHVIVLGYPTVTAVVGAVLSVFGEVNLGAGCWLEVPSDDEQINGFCDASCIALLETMFGGIPFAGVLFLVVICNFIIYLHVRTIYRRASFLAIDSPERRTRAVATQAFLYVAVFLVTYIWTLIIRMASQQSDPSEEARLFPVMVLRAIFLPLMGLGTVLVYARPRYLRPRAQFPGNSCLTTLKSVLWEGQGESAVARRPETSASRSSFQQRSTSLLGALRSGRFSAIFVGNRNESRGALSGVSALSDIKESDGKGVSDQDCNSIRSITVNPTDEPGGDSQRNILDLTHESEK